MAAAFSFGTAGIRARVGSGAGELNVHSVRGIAEAVFGYLALSPDARTRGVCVGFDGRADSRAFAAVVIEAAREAGFLVRAFATEVPTPLLAFATRMHGAAAGLMITASHNPPADNGIKLYLAGGAQITAPHDAAIEARLASPGTFAGFEARGAQRPLGEVEIAHYLEALRALSPITHDPLPVLAYSATCGVGSAVTRRVLQKAGAHAHEVRAQAEPRADFGGLASPNPEHEEALRMLREHADAVAAEVAFAHDPDADRLAVLTRDHGGALRVLSGDEVGALLGDFLLAQTADATRTLMATSHVSGDLLERIVAAHGATLLRTNTGFKWITSAGRDAARATGATYVFGYEEAIGYAFGALGDDKDGIAALHVMLALLRAARKRGHTLLDVLHRLSRKYGSHGTRQLSVSLTGHDAAEKRAALVAHFAALDPSALLGEPAELVDHRRAREPATLLELRGAAGTRVCVRPSGTEPKVKFYLHARANVAAHEAVGTAEARVHAALAALALRVEAATNAP